MTPDVERELVTAAEIARRLGLTPQRIRQLAQENKLPPAAGQAGRNRLWLWESIADWAASTGRVPEENRPATQAWRSRRARTPQFRRSTDSVISWGRGSTVHVRIWQPLTSKLRPVVLLGELDDNAGMSVTNGVELAATTVAAQLLGSGGLHADWYEYWPDRRDSGHEFHSITFTVSPPSNIERPPRGLTLRQFSAQRASLLGGILHDPQWSDIDRETLEELVGETIEVYPHGAYRRAVVERFVVSGPFDLEWDPEQLRRDIDAAITLLDSGLPSETVCDLVTVLCGDYEMRAAENLKNSERQVRDLAVRLCPYRPSEAEIARIKDTVDFVARDKDSTSPPLESLVDRQQSLRRWLNQHGTRHDQLLLVPGSQGLSWLDPWEVGIDEERLEAGTPLAVAIRHADERVVAHIYGEDSDAVDDDFPLVVPSGCLDAKGQWARRYLETVSWWGPRAEDDLRRMRLTAQLEPEASFTSGYDPWGRLVLKSGGEFVVEWPLGPLTSSPPDESIIVANSSDRAESPVFIALPDGRLDLLPAPANRRGGISFTWGYAGGGPATLASALHQLVTSTPADGWRPASDGIDDLIVHYKSSKLHIPVGQLRRLAGSPRRSERSA